MDAYAKSRTPPEVRDKRATPRWAYEAIVAAVGVRPVWDVAAEAHTSVCGPRYFGDGVDALRLSWMGSVAPLHPRPVFWMNPPYSDPAVWCAKAAEEARNGAIVIGLLPDDRSTGWYQSSIHGVAPVVFLPPLRIPFLMPHTGEEQAGNPKGSIVPIWTPWSTGSTVEVYIPRKLWRSFMPSRKKGSE